MAKKLGLLFLLGCLFLSLPVSAASSPEPVKWTAVNIPTQGKPGWVLASGSDVVCLAAGSNGALYAYANPPGAGQTFFRSGDGGYSWSAAGNINESLVGIAVAPNNPNLVVCATTAKVYRSSDGGNSFVPLPLAPGGSGAGNIEITSVAVAQPGASPLVAVATRDTDAGEFGGVYLLDEGVAPPAWVDTGIGAYDVNVVAFSPDYLNDKALLAVVTDETKSLVAARCGANPWGGRLGAAELRKGNAAAVVASAASIAFPANYSAAAASSTLYVGISVGGDNGDVYRVDQAVLPAASTASDLNIGAAYGAANLDVSSLAVSGNGASLKLLAGTVSSAQVYLSLNAGTTWAKSAKPPTGTSGTFVVRSGAGCFAATSGAASAVSASSDDGATWNQRGMMDATITSIVDLAVSPRYSEDNTFFLLTSGGGKPSVWRSRSGKWERVFSGALPGVTSVTGVKIPPDSPATVFLTGTSGGAPGVWKSTTSGQLFIFSPVTDPTGAPVAIVTWAVPDSNTLFIGSFDGTNGCLLRSKNGAPYTRTAVAANSLYSLALSPDYNQDNAILIGTAAGGIYISDDGGASFSTLPTGATSAPLSGNVSVAFDSGYARSRTVYAASDTPGKGLYRFVSDKSRSWEKIDGDLPAGAIINQLAASRGALYAANSKKKGGIERSLDPATPLTPGFETVTRGLEDNSTLTGLWAVDHQLWSIDTTNNQLLIYLDTLAEPVILDSPADRESGLDIKNLSLDWEVAAGATKYHWQADYDGSFSAVPDGFEGDTESSSARLPALEPGTTYCWRVRAIEPVSSPWSAKRTFTTTLGSGAAAPRALSPAGGAREVPLKPVFQWETVSGASGYEFLLATEPSFANPVVARLGEYSLPANVWQCATSLSYETTYYWKIRAWSPLTRSAWSPVSAFTTLPVPKPSPTPIVLPTPILLAPQSGAKGVSTRPFLQWEPVAGASGYELLLATEPSFANPAVARIGDYSLPTNAWQCPIDLSHETTYYWKVRTLDGTYSAWSDIKMFTTEPAPKPSSSPSPVASMVAVPSPSPTTSVPPPVIISLVPPPITASPVPPSVVTSTVPVVPEWVQYWAQDALRLVTVLIGVMVAILGTLLFLALRSGKR